jgi:alkanesulfonate monooxygenase SsuD/methylene tetrahydromethanopterin reductase-like flavin-dependent oxidoreductase (luciferase family)
VRIGAKLPNHGRLVTDIGVSAMARILDQAGFDSIWVADHMPIAAPSSAAYPYGRRTSASDDTWVEALVAMSIACAATQHCEVGVGVLVLPLRTHTTNVARQLASLNLVSRGRVAVGLGAGWMPEEFSAAGADFAQRGRALDRGMAELRGVWAAGPAPVAAIPLLVGGMSRAALRRAAALGDGWYAVQCGDELDVDHMRIVIRQLQERLSATGRDRASFRVTLRLTATATRLEEVEAAAARLAGAGVDELVVDVDWADERSPERTVERLKAAT